MIGYLSGILADKSPIHVVIECSGVGYDVDIPMSTFHQLPDIGHVVLLRTHLSIRDDAHLLFGFFTEEERVFFRQIIRTNGVGTRLALAILSTMSLGQFSAAVMSKDVCFLKTVPGVGSRLAERLTLEMKDFCYSYNNHEDKLKNVPCIVKSALGDVQNALISLGYSAKEIASIIPKISRDASVSDAIKLALKYLSSA
ncbi:MULTISPECIES: Holliday junction branch migration protein RuvA [Candidatus Ichthyocystis]|uniref:Holliday junction branch migration protein RuvA n=1 Tax=Candidatus Ichthyocystis TaxID=2929841 RepID=UPI000B88190B|nr:MULTISPECIES: Holliday junction branch migration protein RuvA [Ichthyocystis]